MTASFYRARCAILIAAVASLSCRSAPHILQLVPACPAPQVSTAGWTEVRSRYGHFSMRLPPGAAEVPVQCIDSFCGLIQVGKWQLSYDSGAFAGSIDTHTTPPEAEAASACSEQISGRSVCIRTYRISPVAQHISKDRLGKLAGDAAVPYAMNLNLGMVACSPSELREFLAAVRTLKVY